MSHSSANAFRCSAWRCTFVSRVDGRNRDAARNRYVTMTSASYGRTARVHRQHRCVANFSSVRARRYRHTGPWPRALHHDGDTNRSAATIIDALATGWIEAPETSSSSTSRALTARLVQRFRVAFADLPPPLQAVLTSLAQRHDGPGALLLAMDGDEVVGCVGLSRSDVTEPTDGLVQRLMCGHRVAAVASPARR